MTAIKEAAVCVACTAIGLQQYSIMVDVHHLISGNKRRGHMFTVGLCGWHHRGLCDWGLTRAEMVNYYGPSLADGSKPFHAMFGSDDDLLALQDRVLSWGVEQSDQ